MRSRACLWGVLLSIGFLSVTCNCKNKGNNTNSDISQEQTAEIDRQLAELKKALKELVEGNQWTTIEELSTQADTIQQVLAALCKRLEFNEQEAKGENPGLKRISQAIEDLQQVLLSKLAESTHSSTTQFAKLQQQLESLQAKEPRLGESDLGKLQEFKNTMLASQQVLLNKLTALLNPFPEQFAAIQQQLKGLQNGEQSVGKEVLEVMQEALKQAIQASQQAILAQLNSKEAAIQQGLSILGESLVQVRETMVSLADELYNHLYNDLYDELIKELDNAEDLAIIAGDLKDIKEALSKFSIIFEAQVHFLKSLYKLPNPGERSSKVDSSPKPSSNDERPNRSGRNDIDKLRSIDGRVKRDQSGGIKSTKRTLKKCRLEKQLDLTKESIDNQLEQLFGVLQSSLIKAYQAKWASARQEQKLDEFVGAIADRFVSLDEGNESFAASLKANKRENSVQTAIDVIAKEEVAASIDEMQAYVENSNQDSYTQEQIFQKIIDVLQEQDHIVPQEIAANIRSDQTIKDHIAHQLAQLLEQKQKLAAKLAAAKTATQQS